MFVLIVHSHLFAMKRFQDRRRAYGNLAYHEATEFLNGFHCRGMTCNNADPSKSMGLTLARKPEAVKERRSRRTFRFQGGPRLRQGFAAVWRQSAMEKSYRQGCVQNPVFALSVPGDAAVHRVLATHVQFTGS
ncbi:MAG: hypothetical protein RQ826_09905 [Xanthomonadales bacterium]|nr:hypothetical protein [Xanthomonadales bacterium]